MHKKSASSVTCQSLAKFFMIESLESRQLLSGAGSGSSALRRDTRYLQQESINNQAEINLGNLALQQSSNSEVDALANRLVTDHTAAQQQLDQVAAGLGITLNTTDRAHQRELAHFTKLGGSGRKFDLAFSKLEIRDHKQGIKRNATEASRAQNPTRSRKPRRRPTCRIKIQAIGDAHAHRC